jgi:hypothetical protein
LLAGFRLDVEEGTEDKMVYEHFRQPIISRTAFFLRIAWHVLIALAIVLVSLGIGMVGYHEFESLSWIDATVNAAMILGGMGPVNVLQTNAGKLFASFYALFSGIIFLVAIALLLAPVVHRFLHRFNFDFDSESSTKN